MLSLLSGVVQLQGGKTNVFLTSFSDKYQHLNKGTTVAYIDTLAELRYLSILESASIMKFEGGAATLQFDISPSLTSQQEHEI